MSRETSNEIDTSSARILLISLVALIALYPALGRRPGLLAALLTLVLIGAVFGVGAKAGRWWALAIGLPFVATIWMTVGGVTCLEMVSSTLGVLFFGFVVVAILQTVLRATHINAGVLYAASSVYLLIGAGWAFAYALVQALVTDAFGPGVKVGWDGLVYFSFVTLTTLGYGDIVPSAPVVRVLAILEAVAGVMFLAILIARLVALYKGGQGN